ncbi:MAG: GNVR domain-containing protein, partial [Methyloligellaceae bacterium]
LEQIEAARQSTADLNNIPEALSSQTISKLRIKLATVLQRRSVLSAELLPSHPTMVNVEAQTKVVRQQIKLELTRIADMAKAEVDRTRSEQSQIEKRLDAIKQSTFVTNDAQVRLRALKRDAEAKRTVYGSFLLRAKELGEQAGVDTTRARIISYAVPPIRPAGLPSILILLIAMIAGLATGILNVLVRGYFSTTSDRPVALRKPLHQHHDMA